MKLRLFTKSSILQLKKYVNPFFPLAPLHFEPLFWEERFDWGAGMAARFVEAPAGNSPFIGNPKSVSAKRGGRPAAPP
jgi:hypothetical protein